MPSMNDKIGGADQLDFGGIIGAPFKDKDWLKKTLIIGLLMLIPIAGALNMSGWMKAIAERRLAGGEDKDILPEASLNYMGAGWRMFLAWLPVVGMFMALLFLFGIGMGIMAAGSHGRAQENLIMVMVFGFYGVVLLLSLAISIVGPAVSFLHIVDGEPWASLQFGRIWETMKAGGTQYFLLFLAMLVAGMVGQLGVIACYVGMFITIPLGQAMAGAAIADYARLVKPQPTSFPLEGGAGGSSGSPFGVKL